MKPDHLETNADTQHKVFDAVNEPKCIAYAGYTGCRITAREKLSELHKAEIAHAIHQGTFFCIVPNYPLYKTDQVTVSTCCGCRNYVFRPFKAVFEVKYMMNRRSKLPKDYHVYTLRLTIRNDDYLEWEQSISQTASKREQERLIIEYVSSKDW